MTQSTYCFKNPQMTAQNRDGRIVLIKYNIQNMQSLTAAGLNLAKIRNNFIPEHKQSQKSIENQKPDETDLIEHNKHILY